MNDALKMPEWVQVGSTVYLRSPRSYGPRTGMVLRDMVRGTVTRVTKTQAQVVFETSEHPRRFRVTPNGEMVAHPATSTLRYDNDKLVSQEVGEKHNDQCTLLRERGAVLAELERACQSFIRNSKAYSPPLEEIEELRIVADKASKYFQDRRV